MEGLQVKRQIEHIDDARYFCPSPCPGICKCSCIWTRKREGEQRECVYVCVCVCMFLSFPSIKQSLFSFPGFKRNLFPGVEPSLTLTLSLCCSIAPIVVSRELFHNHQPKKKKEKRKKICTLSGTSLESHSDQCHASKLL